MSYNLGGGSSSSTATIKARVTGAAEAAADLRRIAEATEAISAATVRSGGAANTASRGFSSWGSVIGSLKFGLVAGAIYGVVNAVKSVTTSVIGAGLSFNSMRENSQIAFTTLLGSAGKAHALLGQLFDLAAHSPFTLTNVQEAAQQLLAMGFAANNLIPMLRSISNLVAANPTLGADAIPRLALVLGQIRSSGRLLGQDALQLFQFGINPYDILAKTLGKTQAQVRALGQAGKLDGQQTVDAILNYADHRFKGLAEAQSHTFSGLLSTLHDLYQQFAGALLAPAMPAIEHQLDRLNKALSDPKVLATLREWEKDVYRVVRALDPFWKGIEQIAEAQARMLLPVLRDFVKAVGPPLILLLDAFGSALQFIAHHQALVALSVGPLVAALKIATGAINIITAAVRKLKDFWQWLHKNSSIHLTASLSLPSSGILGAVTGFAKTVGKTALKSAAPGLSTAAALNSAFNAASSGGGAATAAAGGGGGGTVPAGFSQIVTPVYIDGREVARAVHNVNQRHKRRGP